MPVAFDFRHQALAPIDPSWDEDVQGLAQRNRDNLISELVRVHGEANVDVVVANMMDLGHSPMSCMAWHLQLWEQIRYAFLSGSYYPAAVGAAALGERVLNHLLFDLQEACASASERKVIGAKKPPMFLDSLKILKRWSVLETVAAEQFDALRVERNAMVHYSEGLYETLRDRSLRVVTLLRDALDSQFGLLVPRRLIPGATGAFFLKKEVETEPFITRYLLPLAFHVSPRHEIEHDPSSGYWRVSSDTPSLAAEDTDDEFVRLLDGGPDR